VQACRRREETYDVIFDAVAKSTFGACRRVLRPRGTYVTALPSLGVFFWGAVLPAARLLGDGKRAKSLAAQHGGGVALGPGDGVEAVVDAVDQVHVSEPRRAEHHCGAGRPPARGVVGKVVRAEVRLGLDDLADPQHAPDPVREERAEQVLRHGLGVAVVEGTREGFHPASVTDPGRLRAAIT
jgi:hypothetical protein